MVRPTGWPGVDLIFGSLPGPVGTGSHLLESLCPVPCVCPKPLRELSGEHGPSGEEWTSLACSRSSCATALSLEAADLGLRV